MTNVGFEMSEIGQTLNEYTDTKIKSAAASVDKFGESAVGAVDGLVGTLNQEMQELIGNGIDKVYESLGLTDSNISFAKNILNMGSTAITHVASIISIIPVDVTVLPSAKDCMSPLVASYKEVAAALFHDMMYTYALTANVVMTALAEPMELLAGAVLLVTQEIEKLVDESCYKYTGFHLLEIYNMCAKGFQIVRQLKNLKKQKPDIEEGYDINIDISIDYDARKQEIYQELYTYLNTLTTPLYNAFLMLQLKDTVDTIKDIVDRMVNIDVDIMALNIESIDDIIAIFDRIFGENPTIVSIKEIPLLSLNTMLAVASEVLTALSNATDLSSIPTLQVIAGAVSMVNVDVSKNITYTIELNSEKTSDDTTGKMYYNMTIYKQPGSLVKQITKTLRKIKDSNNKQVISQAEISTFISELKTLWESDSIENDIVISGEIDGAIRLFVFHITALKDSDSNDKTSANTILDKISPDDMPIDDTPEIITRDPKSPIVFDILAIMVDRLKPVVKILRQIAHYIENYKINKAKAQEHARGNLLVSLKDVMENTGLAKLMDEKFFNNNTNDSKETDNSNDTSKPNFYTVRTYKLYDYITSAYNIKPDDKNTGTLTAEQTEQLINDCDDFIDTSLLDKALSTVLYYDMDSINDDKEVFDNALQGKKIERNGTVFKDGTLNGLDTVLKDLYSGEIYISPTGRSTFASEIHRCMQKKYDLHR